jgi:putative ABC transport system permease protein
MNLWRKFKNRDQELEEEIHAHLQMAISDRIARGESPASAQANARREFGNQVLIKEVTRQMWSWIWIEKLCQDVRYIFRQMRRSPGFTAVAVLTLGLGLGAATVMFSIVNGVLLEPLKYREPGRLYLARTVPAARFKIAGDFPVNARHFHEWREKCQSCEEVSLTDFADMTMTGAGQPEKLPTLTVSSNFFKTLGVQPILGRDFLREEELPGRSHEAILTGRLWMTRFSSDRSVIGRDIQLDGETYTVIGVMPADLRLPKGEEWGQFFGPSESPLIFRPLGIDTARESSNGNLNYTSIIRTRPGIGSTAAAAELTALIDPFQRQNKTELYISLRPLQQQVTRNARSALWLLLATVGAVLLIVCVNVGNLMLVRTASRYREAGIRIALGASRSGLFGLVLKESLVLVAIGGVLGLLVAYLGLKLFVASAPVGLPRLEEVSIDWRVLSFAALAIVVSTVICGLFPAWRLSRTQPQQSLKAAGSNSTETGGKLRIRELMASAEVALSTVVLIVGSLLMISFFRLMHVDRGFDSTRVITQDISFLAAKYAHANGRQFVEDIVPKLSQIPGVEIVGATNLLPLQGESWIDSLDSPDLPPKRADEATLANFRFVGPGYMQAMAIRLLAGRFLDESDKNLPRAVIGLRAARYLWPDRSPIGQHVLAAGGEPRPRLEVVGLVDDVPAGGLDKNPPMTVYEHYWRMKPEWMTLAIRTKADPAAVIGSIRQVISAADPEMAIGPARTMEQVVEESVAVRRFQMRLAVAFAVSALLLASLGIYGVISFTVSRRTPEVGIRIALGAQSPQVTGMILSQGMKPVLFGLTVGIAGAWFIGSMISSQLFGVMPHDPAAIFTVVAVLLFVGLAACWLPARRATRIDPLTALRCE